MKALAKVILAVIIAVFGAGGLAQAWAAPPPAAYQGKGRAWGAPRGGYPGTARAWGPRPVWGPRVWWGYGWPGYAWGPRPWWGPAWYGYPAYPYTYYPYAYPPYAYPPPAVVQPNPQTFIQQAPPATAESQAPNYWYYCADSRSYYPYVRECPEGWMTVVPPPSSPAP
jgi:hypothetical protein